ncbi:MAG: hypothetical protein ACP5UV_03560 [Thermoplasmata archaeon]
MMLEFIFFILLLVSYSITVIYSAVHDVKFRAINTFTFVPVFLMASAFYFIEGDYAIMAVFAFIFIVSFMRTSIPLYLAMSLIALFLSFLFLKNPLEFLGIMISGMMLLLGYKEQLFGIGDVKAIITAIYSFLVLKFPYTTYFMPFSLSFLLYTALLSSVFIPYVYIFARKNKLKMKNFNIEFNESVFNSHRGKFRIIHLENGDYMSYRIPFLVPVAAAFFFAIFLP